MRRGELTREHILEQAAALFNQKGYAGASMSDIMEATGLQKGGIYRHFGSKEQLAVEAFDFAVKRMGQRFAAALEDRRHALDRLRAVVEVYAAVPLDPPVPGGCPVMNAAIENDHGNPVLRERVRGAMDGLRGLIRRIAERGIERRELRPDLDPDEVATVLMSTLEGAVMLTQLYDDERYTRTAVAHLERYLEDCGKKA